MSRTPGRALVTGATGFIGGPVADAVAAGGRRVRVLVRPGRGPVDPRWEVTRGDLLDPSCLEEALAGVETVIHCAALVGGDDVAESLHEVNVVGTRNLLHAARGRISRIVFFSSIAVYGGGDVHQAREDAPLVGAGAYSSSKIQGEEDARRVAEEGGFDVVVLRVCQVVGEGDRRFLPRILDLLSLPDLVIEGDGETRVELVHVSDVVSAAILAGSVEAAAGEAFNITGGETATVVDLLSALSARIGRDVPFRSAPGAKGTPGERVLRVEDFTRSRCLDIDKARRLLGYRPRVSPLAWLRARGLEGREWGFTRGR